MADAWETNNMSEALQEVTNQETEGVPADTNPKNEEAHKAAREHGWVEPSAYNYGAGDDGETSSPTNTAYAGEPQWAHSAKKYEWKDEFGDVGPEVPELEQELFRSDYLNRKGNRFNELLAIQVTAEAAEKPAPIASFDDAGLHPVVRANVDLCGYEWPTPIQAYTIPAVLEGKDVIGVAQTGSGKTAAFLIPCISKLMGKAKKLAAARPDLSKGFDPRVDRIRAEPLILIVAPTRELCCQIFDEARRLCYRSMLRPCVAYGGGPTREQVEEFAKGCDILVATPGRLIDFMNRPHVLSLSRVRFTIIDEADEMLDNDWEQEMSQIMSGGDMNEDADHRYLLFSATFDKNMRGLAKKYLANDHVRIRIGRAGSTHLNVKQKIMWTNREAKQQALYDLLLHMPPARTLVFVNSKKTADYVDDFLFNLGLPSTSFHSDRTQREREDALRAFRSGKCPILVATGVSARGLDIRNVMHVINFDLPSADHKGFDEYIHRIGRTARIGNEGLATSFYNDRDEPMADFLVKILTECKQEIPDFLKEYMPEEGGEVNFDDDSGAEDEETNNGNEGWGSGAGGAGSGDTWGAAGISDPGAMPSAPDVTAAAPQDAWVSDNTNGAAHGGG